MTEDTKEQRAAAAHVKFHATWNKIVAAARDAARAACDADAAVKWSTAWATAWATALAERDVALAALQAKLATIEVETDQCPK